MEINKKSRTELKAYFVKNALPTVGNFSDLIDAALNQKDDGIAKSADQPVQIAASTAGDKPAIHLYESFATDTKPAWVLSLQVDGKKGLGISDGDGKNRLFIDGVTGNMGIGTTDPAGNKLRVAGNTLIEGRLEAPGGALIQAIGIGTQIQGATTYPSETIQMKPGNALRVWFGITERFILANNGEFTAAGAVVCGNSDIYFTNTTHDHTGRGNAAGCAAIENAKNHDALMILGRGGTDKGRKVKLWDYLEVIGTFANSSDASKKRDIEPLHYGLAEVKQLRPISFNWISIPNQHKSVGLVAQEVREVIKEVVYEDEGLLSISYQNLVAVLINAIKELDRKVEALSSLKEIP
jgi:hypothetical protein